MLLPESTSLAPKRSSLESLTLLDALPTDNSTLACAMLNAQVATTELDQSAGDRLLLVGFCVEWEQQLPPLNALCKPESKSLLLAQ
jgi:hypothetical protein